MFAITDRELLNVIQADLLEEPNDGASMTSELWTLGEVIQYTNDRLRILLRETAMIATYKTIGTHAGEPRIELADTDIAVRNAWWRDGLTGVITNLDRSESWVVDHMQLSLEPGTPRVFLTDQLPISQIELSPRPRQTGLVILIVNAIVATLSNTGVVVPLPDEFVPFLAFGVLADCFSKTGPAQDLERAAYGEDRFQEGIALGQMLMAHD